MYNRSIVPTFKITTSHPFKIDILRNGSKSDGTPQYGLAVSFHSRLFTGLSKTEEFLQYNQINITGLDFLQNVPASFPGKNYYCILKIMVSNLQATSAKIEWVSDDASVDSLQPVKFQSSQDRRQTEARIIIGVLVNDDEAIAGTPPEGLINTTYIIQNINTNLIMCNMVFDGIPVVYPVPFAGGRQSANLFGT
jgi:hypothetical protein